MSTTLISFFEVANENKRLNVYVDYLHEPLFHWIQEEEPNPEDDTICIEDVGFILADRVKDEHENDVSYISVYVCVFY